MIFLIKKKLKKFSQCFLPVTIIRIKATYFNSYFLSSINSLWGDSVNINTDIHTHIVLYIYRSMQIVSIPELEAGLSVPNSYLLLPTKISTFLRTILSVKCLQNKYVHVFYGHVCLILLGSCLKKEEPFPSFSTEN